MRAIDSTNPDFVYVASYPTDSVGIVRAATRRLKAKLFGGAMVGLQYGALKTQLGAQPLNNIVVHDFYVPEPTLQFPGIEAFLKRYQAKVVGAGMDPLGYFVPPFAYANLQVLGQAVEAVGSPRSGKLSEHPPVA